MGAAGGDTARSARGSSAQRGGVVLLRVAVDSQGERAGLLFHSSPGAWPPLPQAEAHAHDAYDFSDDEGVPPFRQELSAAAKRSHAAAAGGGGRRGGG